MLNLMQIDHLLFFRDAFACKLADGKFRQFCKIWQISNLMPSVFISASIWRTRVLNIWFPLDEQISSLFFFWWNWPDNHEKKISPLKNKRVYSYVDQVVNNKFCIKKEKAHLVLMRWRQAKSLTAAIFQPFKRNDDTNQ